jgi:hypothetical protein
MQLKSVDAVSMHGIHCYILGEIDDINGVKGTPTTFCTLTAPDTQLLRNHGDIFGYFYAQIPHLYDRAYLFAFVTTFLWLTAISVDNSNPSVRVHFCNIASLNTITYDHSDSTMPNRVFLKVPC